MDPYRHARVCWFLQGKKCCPAAELHQNWVTAPILTADADWQRSFTRHVSRNPDIDLAVTDVQQLRPNRSYEHPHTAQFSVRIGWF
jgi:hypothetical protein